MIYSEWFVGAGISSYEEDPPALRPHLQVCLQEAESVVPNDKYRSTPVYLGATAGMRLIQCVLNQNSITETSFFCQEYYWWEPLWIICNGFFFGENFIAK